MWRYHGSEPGKWAGGEVEAARANGPGLDTLLPSQYFETLRRKAHLEAEKRLMLALLEDGIVCFQKHLFARTRKKKALFGEAEEWLMERGGDWIFTFESICETLGIHPAYVRHGLAQWKERQLATRGAAVTSARKRWRERRPTS
jgi:hypothetical protein